MDPGARGRRALLDGEPVSEAEDDLLGGRRAAGKLARLLIDSRTSTPFTLAVDAGWGMGKSSLMRLVDAELRKASGVHTIWYNAWTSTGADTLEGLIKSVLTGFGRRTVRRALRRSADSGVLLGAGRWLLLGLSAPFGVTNLVDELWTRLSHNARARNEMRQNIDRLARDWSANPRSPRLLVVFVDDLDRCSEETVLAVCEAVKIYLDVPGLAFVVGGDRAALSPAGLLRDLTPAGAAFMEKVFQTSYRVPVANEGDVREYVRACARKAGIDHLLDDELLRLLAERSARNPRRIKRLVNGFVLEATLNPVWQDFGPEAVIRVLLLQYLYADFYRMMTSPAGAVGGDVIAEFRTYQETRPLLRGTGELTGAQRNVLVDFLSRYGIPLPDDPAQRGATLTELEEQLPSGFPDLVSDPAFTSLLAETLELPDAARLTERLRVGRPETPGERADPAWAAAVSHPSSLPYLDVAGPPPQRAFDVDYEPPAWYTDRARLENRARQDGAGSFYSRAYVPLPGDAPVPVPRQEASATERALAGKHILWIDDAPEGLLHWQGLLEARGAQVRLVRTAEELQARLADDSPDLLISDITRFGDQQAGFTTLQALRRDDTYTGPAIFYTGRVTPVRQRRAQELGASVTADPGALLVLAAEALGAPVR
jgi:CheY-like chemotaxis protein